MSRRPESRRRRGVVLGALAAAATSVCAAAAPSSATPALNRCPIIPFDFAPVNASDPQDAYVRKMGKLGLRINSGYVNTYFVPGREDLVGPGQHWKAYFDRMTAFEWNVGRSVIVDFDARDFLPLPPSSAMSDSGAYEGAVAGSLALLDFFNATLVREAARKVRLDEIWGSIGPDDPRRLRTPVTVVGVAREAEALHLPLTALAAVPAWAAREGTAAARGQPLAPLAPACAARLRSAVHELLPAVVSAEPMEAVRRSGVQAAMGATRRGEYHVTRWWGNVTEAEAEAEASKSPLRQPRVARYQAPSSGDALYWDPLGVEDSFVEMTGQLGPVAGTVLVGGEAGSLVACPARVRVASVLERLRDAVCGLAPHYNVETLRNEARIYPTNRRIVVPPVTIPPNLLDEYTLGGQVPAHAFEYRSDATDDTFQGRVVVRYWDHATWEGLLEDVAAQREKYYAYTDTLLHRLFARFSLAGKSVVIAGSEVPLYEAMAHHYGAANITTLEYGLRYMDDPPFTRAMTPSQFEAAPETFDVALSISSFEHDGLGRYGDPLQGDADLVTMRKYRSIVKPGGHMVLVVPVGQDAIVHNLHRVYGRLRWPLLTAGWEIVDSEGIVRDPFDVDWRLAYQPVLLLRNPGPPEDA